MVQKVFANISVNLGGYRYSIKATYRTAGGLNRTYRSVDHVHK